MWKHISSFKYQYIIKYIWVKFFKIMILPKTGHFFFNFKHQLLHIFQWDGQNQDIPYDQLEEESHNILSNFAIVSYMSVNLSVYFLYSGAHKNNLVGPRIQKNRLTDWQTYS